MAGRFLSLTLFLLAIPAAYWLDHRSGREAAYTLWIGIALGFVLQRSRFCFFCNLREAIEDREPRPLLAIVIALAVATLGAVVIFSAWIPDAAAGYLPQRGHLSPTSWPMLVGGFIFGVGMALSGSCISAHLYRIAEGSLLSLLALATALIGFSLGDLFWNPVYLASYRTASVLWLPRFLGFGGAFLLQLSVLGLLAFWLWKRRAPAGERDRDLQNPAPPQTPFEAIFARRWPWWFGGIAVGIVATAALFRTQPLGVTAEFSRLGHLLAQSTGWAPERLEGVSELRGCIVPTRSAFLSQNALLLIGLVGGAFISALPAGGFRWHIPRRSNLISAALGGILLGVGARAALGCTIGTLLGGISALSLSGWLFAMGLFAGVAFGLKIRRSP